MKNPVKKLVLNKHTVARLNNLEMMRLHGGDTGESCSEFSEVDPCPSSGTTTTLDYGPGRDTEACVTLEYTCNCPTYYGVCYN